MVDIYARRKPAQAYGMRFATRWPEASSPQVVIRMDYHFMNRKSTISGFCTSSWWCTLIGWCMVCFRIGSMDGWCSSSSDSSSCFIVVFLPCFSIITSHFIYLFIYFSSRFCYMLCLVLVQFCFVFQFFYSVVPRFFFFNMIARNQHGKNYWAFYLTVKGVVLSHWPPLNVATVCLFLLSQPSPAQPAAPAWTIFFYQRSTAFEWRYYSVVLTKRRRLETIAKKHIMCLLYCTIS